MDFAGFNELGHGANGILNRCLRINPVLIVEVDHVYLQPAQRGITSGAHIVRLAIDADESTVSCPDIAELGGEHNLASTIPDRLAHQLFIAAEAVNVSSVEESHAELDGAVNCGDRLGPLSGSVEIAHAHAAKPERRSEQSGSTQFTRLHFNSVHLTWRWWRWRLWPWRRRGGGVWRGSVASPT